MPETADELQAELERTREALKKANSEAAERRKKLEALEAAEQERANKGISEQERLKKERDAALAEKDALANSLRQTKISTAVLLKATELGFANPADAIALADLSTVEIAEDGTVKGFEKSLQALVDSGRLPVKGQVEKPIGTPLKGNHRTETSKVDISYPKTRY